MKQLVVLLAGALSLSVPLVVGFSTNLVVRNNERVVPPFKTVQRGGDTALSMVQATPPAEHAFSSTPGDDYPREKRPSTNRIRKLRTNKERLGKNNGRARQHDREDRSGALERAVKVESQMVVALEALQGTMVMEQGSGGESTTKRNMPATDMASRLFPSIRECNAALAAFGDAGQLLRALRLFMKMRKAALLAQYLRGWSWPVPSPTLVTYSTIMSRANRVGKPKVALRMWKLMQKSPEFVWHKPLKSSAPATDEDATGTNMESNQIVPDVKAANILMNSFAKLADKASAQDLLNQMLHGNGPDVPRLEPNLVTYNTFLDACHKADDLDAALDAMRQLEESGLTPDAWSYTSLIATVARKPSSVSGANDPSMAFSLLKKMRERNIQPNGMTYSALIDACGRCKRCDLALQGLRIMLRQKAAEQQMLTQQRAKERQGLHDNQRKKKAGGYRGNPENYSLSNEVGAWTAAINALGKEGRIRAAMRLFFSMSNFGVKPNTVTCGCLTDSLLKHGRIADALRILRYMEENGIVPSEVMYTSLMSSAGILAQQEMAIKEHSNILSLNNDDDSGETTGSAIEVYTLLMKSLTESREPKNSRSRTTSAHGDIQDSKAHALMKVFLVFQEMKEAGAQPDLACYNALFRACARAGDINRAQSVLKQMEEDALEPNDSSWRQLIRAAGNAKRYDIVLSTWKMAVGYSYDIKSHLGSFNSQIRSSHWVPSIETFSSMISALLRSAADPNLPAGEKSRLYRWIIVMYQRILSGNKDEQLGMHRVDKVELFEDSRAMLLVLEAIVGMDHSTPLDVDPAARASEKSQLRRLASQILRLESLHDITNRQRLSRSSFRSLCIAKSWATDDDVGTIDRSR